MAESAARPPMQPLPKRDDETLRDYSLRVLRHNIVTLAMEPGKMYSEKELADSLSLSRTPMRESLRQLAQTRIVEIYPQRGTAIALVDYDLIEEARFVREALECAVVRLLAKIITPCQIQELQKNVERQKRCAALENDAGLMELDLAFHEMLFRFAGKQQCHDFVCAMTIHMDRLRSMSLKAVKTHSFVRQHEELLNALIANDGEEAAELMKKHVSGYLIEREAILKTYPQYVKP